MDQELGILVSNVDSYLDGKISSDDLSQLTLAIISDDAFDQLEDSVKDALYTLDNLELNSLSKEDLLKLRHTIAEYIQ